MNRTACSIPIIIAIAGCGLPDPASAGAAENYPHARALLAGIKVPNATALQAEVSQTGESDLIKVTFEGRHHLWLDRQSGMPTRYVLAETQQQQAGLLPLYEGPLATNGYGHDPLEAALQGLLDVELAIGPWVYHGYEYLVLGMPVFELRGIKVFWDQSGVITELKNMTTIEVDVADQKISLQEARDIAVSHLTKFNGGPLTYKVHDLQLGYARTSKSTMPVTVRRAWRVPIGTQAAAFDFYIDAETGKMIDGYRANSSGRKSIPAEGDAAQDMVTVGAVDPDKADHVIKLLKRHGIEAIVEGSVAYGVRVPKAKAQLIIKLLREESKREGYWFKEG